MSSYGFSDQKYYGLYNQGSTGYLNSVLQVLFMTEECRKAVESLNTHDHEGLNSHLKRLFESLKKETTRTHDITPFLDIMDEFIQQDAAEYFDKILNMVHKDVSKVFNGSLRHTSTCSENHQTINEVCSLWTLPLSLEGPSGEPYSVMDGSQFFFKGSFAIKDNVMYCDECKARKPGQHIYEMEKEPVILTLLLKRYEYDDAQRSYVKTMREVKLPPTLQTENVQYELYAIVDHSGSLTGGHYTVQIKSYEDQKWYKFDNDNVRQLTDGEVSALQKSKQAYLLMYKKCGEGLGKAHLQMQEYSYPTTAGSKRENGSGEKKHEQADSDSSEHYGASQLQQHEREGFGIRDDEILKQTTKRQKKKSVTATSYNTAQSNFSKNDYNQAYTMTEGQEEQMTVSHSDSPSSYSYDQQRLNVPQTEYHGLYNQGSTCYLNSVLQVLFMTKECREAVLSLKTHEGLNSHLKRLFESLKKETTHTRNITPFLDIMDEFIQQDAAEYFEKILNMVYKDVSKVFNGSLRHTSTCSKNHQTSNEVCSFWTLPLSLEGPSGEPYSVMDGFNDFFKGSHATGDNMMYCDTCQAKKDGRNTCKMEKEPMILTLLLKRFDYRSRSYFKIMSEVEIPPTLQTENVQYELYAIVDHCGSLDGGHYTVQIKSYEDQKWYEFDDINVRQLTDGEVSALQKSNQAYLLMYKKRGEGLNSTFTDARMQ